MKRILIVYHGMIVGGSTTSLLSFLNEIDYKEYSVDLALCYRGCKLENLIPPKVNVIGCILPYSKDELYKKKRKSIRSIIARIKGSFYDCIKKNTNIHSMISQEDSLRYCSPLNAEYDIAISFLEGLSLYYLSEKVTAKKKVAWIHLDYIGAGLKDSIDRKYFRYIDNIVLVSKSCKSNFDFVFPEYSQKTVVIENILSSKFVNERANVGLDQKLPIGKIKFVSVCGISFSSKGLDRGVNALARLKKEGYNLNGFIWYIIGTGGDVSALKEMVEKNRLGKYVVLCGEKLNPLPFEKECDIFFLPSRYEGKPMAVTEAQMLGLVPVVTRYSAAAEQINNGIDGIILENSDEAVYDFFKKFISQSYDFSTMKKNVIATNYSNLDEMKKIYNLF